MSFKGKGNAEYEKVLKAMGAVGYVEAKDVTAQVSGSGSSNFAVGDVIEIPEDHVIFERDIQGEVDYLGNQRKTYTTVVKVTSKAGKERFEILFISIFGKRMLMCEVDEKKKYVGELGYEQHKGTAAEFFQSKAGMLLDDAFDSLAAEYPRIEVTAVENKYQIKYGTRDNEVPEAVPCKIFTFDGLKEDKA